MKQILVIGSGAGGVMAANRIRGHERGFGESRECLFYLLHNLEIP